MNTLGDTALFVSCSKFQAVSIQAVCTFAVVGGISKVWEETLASLSHSADSVRKCNVR